MRNFRLLLTATSMAAFAIGGLVACGDDDTGGITNPGVDSGATSSSSSGGTGTSGGTSGSPTDGGTDSGGKPTASAKADPVYAGQTATLDGSGSTGANLTYAWTLTAPVGSTATLTGGTTAKPTFVADKVGKYTAKLVVTGGGQTSEATIEVEAFDAPIFFFSNEANPGEAKLDRAQFRRTTANGDGDAGIAVACFEQDAGANGVDGVLNKAQVGAAVWSDWWEAPAGQPSRAVFAYRTDEGGPTGRLFGVTSTGTCETAPTSLDMVPTAEVTDEPFEVPRFSPNGSRVLYIRSSQTGGYRISTVGFDGAAKRNIAARQTYSDGGQEEAGRFGANSSGPRPAWIDDTNVAWLTRDSNTAWQIMKAPDAENAAPTLHMSCTGPAGTYPGSFAVLPNGDVLVSERVPDADANAVAVQLRIYTPDATTKACATPRDISKLVSATGDSRAEAFTLSPDKTRVAYYANDEIAGTVRVMVANLDGSGTPQAVGVATTAYMGPRWIAGGSHLSWGVSASSIDGGGTGENALVVASVASDAGPRTVVASDTTRTNYAIGTTGCSLGYGVGSAMSGFGFLGLLGLGITRRKSKKK